MSAPFLELDGVGRRFDPYLTLGDRIAARLGARVEDRPVHAVTDVSISIDREETVGLVGESGCGKSTLGRIAAGILEPTTGAVSLEGGPIVRGGRKVTIRVQSVFQDPFASLDPRMPVGDIIAEGPITHGLVSKADAQDYVHDWLVRVGLQPELASRYPHQFSGGQRQRVAIARALAMRPDVLVCDEPVASLDVSIQAQIINLFLELREGLGITCLFISHDLGVVRHVSDRVAIMYLGRIVEIGPTERIYRDPQHPYTRGLLDSVPRLVLDEGRLVEFQTITGEIPSALAPPPGCAFHPRCPIAAPVCRREIPALHTRSDARQLACHVRARDRV